MAIILTSLPTKNGKIESSLAETQEKCNIIKIVIKYPPDSPVLGTAVCGGSLLIVMKSVAKRDCKS